MSDEIYAGDVDSMLDRLLRQLFKEDQKLQDELQELDALAHFVEIARLQQQGVLFFRRIWELRK